MTTRPRAELHSPDERVAPSPRLALAAALAGATASGIAWYVLSMATGLIFHFMPGAPVVAAAFVFRHVIGSRRGTIPEVVAIVTGGLAVVSAGLLAIRAGGGSLDAPGIVGVVVVVAVGAAAIWLRRTGPVASRDGRPPTE